MTALEISTFRATVRRTEKVSPHMMRVSLSEVIGHGDTPDASFASSGHPDEFIALTIPARDPDGEDVRRYYTIRAWDARTGELDIDFVLHGHGPAAAWAATAKAGDVIEFEGPRGHYEPPTDARWMGLVGDATALPALCRIMEERSEGAPAHVVIAIDDERDRPALPLRDGDSVRWLEETDDLLAATIALTELPGAGYVWFSGEASEMRAVRGHLRKTLGWPTSHWDTMAYWRRDAERWRERFDSFGPELAETFERIYESDGDPEVLRDRAEEVFVRYGL